MRRNLVILGQDLEEDCWFAWNAAETDPNRIEAIYCVDESGTFLQFYSHWIQTIPIDASVERSPPPLRIAKDFKDFLNNVCLGNRLRKLGFRKTPANPNRQSEFDLDNDAEEEDDDGEEELPQQIFKPFPVPRM